MLLPWWLGRASSSALFLAPTPSHLGLTQNLDGNPHRSKCAFDGSHQLNIATRHSWTYGSKLMGHTLVPLCVFALLALPGLIAALYKHCVQAFEEGDRSHILSLKPEIRNRKSKPETRKSKPRSRKPRP